VQCQQGLDPGGLPQGLGHFGPLGHQAIEFRQFPGRGGLFQTAVNQVFGTVIEHG
jgi:hypothetical protein